MRSDETSLVFDAGIQKFFESIRARYAAQRSSSRATGFAVGKAGVGIRSAEKRAESDSADTAGNYLLSTYTSTVGASN